MGQLSIQSQPSAAGTNAQTIVVPPQTSEVNSLQSMQPKNPQQPGGKKKRNKKKNSTDEKGTTTTQTSQEGGTKEKRKAQFPCTICGEDHPTHQCPQKDEIHQYLAQQRGPPTTYCINSSLPSPTSKHGCLKSFPSTRGITGTPHHEGSSSNASIYMCDHMVNLQTQNKNYDIPEPSNASPDATSSSQPSGPLQIEKPFLDAPLHPPKGILHHTTHHPNAWATHNYNIVEDLAQAPCAMSALKVLQSFPMQWKELLSAIGGVDPSESSLITFDTTQVTHRLSHQVSFHIKV
jgi:hypothetical protein